MTVKTARKFLCMAKILPTGIEVEEMPLSWILETEPLIEIVDIPEVIWA